MLTTETPKMAVAVKSQFEPLVVRYWSPAGRWTLKASLRRWRVSMVVFSG